MVSYVLKYVLKGVDETTDDWGWWPDAGGQSDITDSAKEESLEDSRIRRYARYLVLGGRHSDIGLHGFSGSEHTLGGRFSRRDL